MDNFVEQIVVKKSETKDNLKRLGLFFGGLVICLASLTAELLSPIPMIFMLLAIGSIWLTWLLFQSTFIEYEYIITNNEMDIDKIFARKRRKRLITLKIDKAEAWGEYSDGKGSDVAVTVQAHDCQYKNLWYIVFMHEKYGKTNLLFSPNRAVLEAVNKSLPYSLRRSDFKAKRKEEELETET
ncbi:MAG: hypothetical protein FWE60_01620 [Oscillospiraceae bacterium]|jgi:energy-coupling factor transporter transmembrane protein EcfT|nr:hypothetical protein [Oscillospiraceae bacterium]